MRTIAVNALFMVPGQVGGTETYLRRTLSAIPPLLAPDERLVVFANAENADVLAADLAGAPRVRIVQTGLRASSRVRRVVFENFALPGALRRAGASVVWNPGNAAPTRSPCPQATTIHDMQYKRFPEDFPPVALLAMRALVPAAVRRSAAVIAVSEFSKSEILRFVPGTPPDRVTVTPEAADPLFSSSPSDLPSPPSPPSHRVTATPESAAPLSSSSTTDLPSPASSSPHRVTATPESADTLFSSPQPAPDHLYTLSTPSDRVSVTPDAANPLFSASTDSPVLSSCHGSRPISAAGLSSKTPFFPAPRVYSSSGQDAASAVDCGKNSPSSLTRRETYRIRAAGLAGFPVGTPFVLVVSNSYPHKSLETAVRAFGMISGSVPHWLVVVGRPRRGEPALRAAFDALPDRSRAVRLEYAERTDLAALYASADALVFPSLYEGFGLPVLEAMSSGLPVVAAAEGSVPEVGGNAAVYARGGDAADFARVLGALLADPPERARRSALGRDRAACFSWDKTAAATLSVLRSIARPHKTP